MLAVDLASLVRLTIRSIDLIPILSYTWRYAHGAAERCGGGSAARPPSEPDGLTMTPCLPALPRLILGPPATRPLPRSPFPPGRTESQGRMDRHQQRLTTLVKNWLMRSVERLERRSRALTPNEPDSPAAALGLVPGPGARQLPSRQPAGGACLVRLEKLKLPTRSAKRTRQPARSACFAAGTEETSFLLATPDEPENGSELQVYRSRGTNEAESRRDGPASSPRLRSASLRRATKATREHTRSTRSAARLRLSWASTDRNRDGCPSVAQAISRREPRGRSAPARSRARA
jgi:hypothetical protein